MALLSISVDVKDAFNISYDSFMTLSQQFPLTIADVNALFDQYDYSPTQLIRSGELRGIRVDGELRFSCAAVEAVLNRSDDELEDADLGGVPTPRAPMQPAEIALAALRLKPSDHARRVLELRVAHPEATLRQLAELAHPPLTLGAVSGVLHRAKQMVEAQS